MKLECTEMLEYRGVEIKSSKKKNIQYSLVHLENSQGNSFEFYCKDTTLSDKFSKGDIVAVTFEYNPKYNSIYLAEVR